MPSENSEVRDSEDTASAHGDSQAPRQRNLDSTVVSKWEAFFQETEYLQRIREVSDLYPEVRSINVVYSDLDKVDIELAIYLLEHPDIALIAGKEAIRNLMHQEKRKAEINLRVTALPRDSRVEVRDFRSKHVGKMISVEGLVRKATEVRPKITAGLFQCLRCGTVIKEQQEGLFFKEPMECYKDQNGCGRSAGSTKFKLLTDESRFIDTQKIEIQESPEGLRGGAQPERLVGYLEDDITGRISPGDRIILNGILRSVQKGQPTKSTLFDINLDIISAEHQEHEYEEIVVNPEDEAEIIAHARSPDLFKKIVASVSPTIYGYDVEKEAIALQLFSGVPKVLDDGTRIRGDIHILLVGDPGVAKCVTGDTDVWLSDCSTRKIKDIVDEALGKGEVNEVDDGVWAPVDLKLITLSNRGKIEVGKAVRVWKRRAPEKMIRVRTKGGRELKTTPTHPLFVPTSFRIGMRSVSDISVGANVVAVTGLACEGIDDTYGWKRGFELDLIDSKEEIDPSEEWVYDLEVEGTHNFVTNGLLSHNSQLLRYMATLAPRGIYASGKSSSAAGLCVAPDTSILTDKGKVEIGEFVEEKMKSPQEIKPNHWSQDIEGQSVKTISSDGRPTLRSVISIWRINTPSFLVEIVEKSGKRLTLTPETPLRCKPDGQLDRWVKASDIVPGQYVLTHATTSNGEEEGFHWKRVKEKRIIQSDLPKYVYDLTVDGSHSFVGNGFVVHNTAAAVKDEFGEGRWTLEAGALVLADKGICLVDELDKMTDQDRSAMHEAMEAQQISIAKAGITATLQCRCSLLAAANPKYGRFEEHQYIADQINLPPALMSRFDLIFAMTDKPNAVKDASMTDHILRAHRRGQIKKYADPSEIQGMDVDKIIEESNSLKPIFSREFFRKYVAYSKRINPVLSDDAMKIIREYYLRIRKQGEGEGSSVPITARQLEAFVRLSEASARARLSQTVTKEDAERAVGIVDYYLRKIAGEAGKLDIDIITTGTSHSQREQITILRQLISELSDPKRGVSTEELAKAAEAKGISDDRVKTLVKRLSQNGEIFSPSSGYYKLTSEG